MSLTSPSPSRTRRRALTWLTLAALLGAGLAAAQPAAAASLDNLALGGTATASSSENPTYLPASAAFDGDTSTRWASQWADPQWIQVDLGEVSHISQLQLQWEVARATSYRIEVSDTGTGGWKTVYSTTDAPGGIEKLDVDADGRFVRLTGTDRANGYGYSLWEFGVYGTHGAGPVDPVDPVDPGTPDPGYPSSAGPLTAASTVAVTGTEGDWKLRVDGQPYTVRGFTWGPPMGDAAQYMDAFTATGANTTRTWGTDAGTVTLLDAAAAKGVRVINGFWLVPGGGPGSGGCIDYTTDANYKSTTKADILKWVGVYKTHPATLMWNVGNESLLGLQNCYSGAQLEAQRVAYAQYVNEVAVAIHAADPTHPVTSTDAWTGAWPYYRDHAPALDLLSVNSYGDICGVKGAWEAGHYGKPYIITEGGPAGEWEVPDDANGVPDQPTDLENAQGYVDAWRCIRAHAGVALGGTLFHFGLEGDLGATWFNIYPGGNRRLAYYSIAEVWNGSAVQGNRPPRIADMTIAHATSVEAGSTVTVDLPVTDPDGDALDIVTFVNSKYIDGNGGVTWVAHEQQGSRITFTAPARVGVWKSVIYVEDGHGNVGVETRSFRVVPPAVSGTNVAAGKTATASSFQVWGDNYSPGQAFDGDFATRWSSEWAPTGWIQVDLGQSYPLSSVQLVWEAAFAKSYTVQLSDDGVTWRTAATVTGGDGGIDQVGISGQARYVKFDLTERGTDWGFSLYEVGVYSG
ncbi:discoidin domain-containing protein [Microbacterium sp. NPDC058389]|uniref:discoidin domain-containing protein n=1 Tax=Microbacterium sp. NPDC058389 TaxID=3346475 RepID=UPI00365A4E00